MKILHQVNAVFFMAILLMAGCDQPTNLQTENNKPDAKETISQAIPGQFIVVFKDVQTKGLDKSQKAQAVNSAIENMTQKYEISDQAVKNKYAYSLHGFTAQPVSYT